jgi:hypothetical protein
MPAIPVIATAALRAIADVLICAPSTGGLVAAMDVKKLAGTRRDVAVGFVAIMLIKWLE